MDKDGDGHGHAAQGDARGLAAAALEFFEANPEEETEQPQHQGDEQDAGSGPQNLRSKNVFRLQPMNEHLTHHFQSTGQLPIQQQL